MYILAFDDVQLVVKTNVSAARCYSSEDVPEPRERSMFLLAYESQRRTALNDFSIWVINRGVSWSVVVRRCVLAEETFSICMQVFRWVFWTWDRPSSEGGV